MASKYYIGIIIIVICVLLIVLIRTSSQRKPITFRIYYDKITPIILDGMSKYNLNIVEGSFFEKKDVVFLHSQSSKVVGYLSLIEIGYWDTPLVSSLNEEDYLLNDFNEKTKNLSKTNFLGDLSSKHYRDVLFKYLKIRILDKGMDGVFFDTLDWIDYYANDKRIYDKLTEGYKSFLMELRQKYPEILIIQNRGFESYEKFSNNYINGILWENFKSPYIENDSNKIKEFKEFNRMTRLNKTDVFVISFENENENRKIAKKFKWNFAYSQMDNRYSKWDILLR